MSMAAALYYPHSTIATRGLLKNALLLWDRVECISPRPGYHPPARLSGQYAEALELVSVQHVPTATEREAAHRALATLLANGLPDWFRLDVSQAPLSTGRYEIHDRKFAEATWHLLQAGNFADLLPRNRHDPLYNEYRVTPALGLLLMATLAEACAGSTRRRITDRTEAYILLNQLYTAESGGDYMVSADVSIASHYDRLVSISVRTINADDIPLDRLTEMRKREARESGSDLAQFRRRYLDAVDRYVQQIMTVTTEGDVRELERLFEEELEADLRSLRAELRLQATKTLLSKEMVVTALVGAGMLMNPVAGLTTLANAAGGCGVGALLKSGAEYTAARRKALLNSSMSWLYLTSRSRLL